MARDNFVVDVTVSPTTADHPLGMIYIEPANFWDRNENVVGVGAAAVDQGEREWIWTHVVTDTLAQGLAIRRGAGRQDYLNCGLIDAAGTMPALRVPGISQIAATPGDYQFVLRRGMGAAQSDSNSTIDLAFVGSNAVAAGNIRDATTGTNDYAILGVALDEDGGAAILVNAWINCPG